MIVDDDVKWVMHASRSCFYQQIWRRLLAEGPVPRLLFVCCGTVPASRKRLAPSVRALSNGAHIISLITHLMICTVLVATPRLSGVLRDRYFQPICWPINDIDAAMRIALLDLEGLQTGLWFISFDPAV